MYVSRSAASERQVDESMTITDYFPATASQKLSVVSAHLVGEHSLRLNKECDQVYYVLEGTGSITVDDEQNSLSKGDAVLIKSGQKHALHGELELLIINGPSYDFTQTEILA